jgi:hypothetical protein
MVRFQVKWSRTQVQLLESRDMIAQSRSAGYLASFFVGFMVRVVPEAIAYPAPIGYNTVAYYAPVLFHFKDWGNALFINLFYPPQFSPLVYLLMIPSTLVMNPFTVLAIFAPVLHGLLAVMVYHYLRYVTHFAGQIALLGAFFAIIQFPVLGLSLGMFSEMLAFSLGILALSLLPKVNSTRKVALLASLLILTGLAHQIVLLTILPCIYYFAVARRKSNPRYARGLVLSSAPALVFLAWNFLILQNAHTVLPAAQGVTVWFLWSSASSAGISPFSNYFAQFGSYFNIVLTILGFLLFLVAPVLPLLILHRLLPSQKAKRPSLCAVWAVAVLLLAVSPIISPWFAFDLWYIWAFTLSVPVSIIAFEGFAKLLSKVQLRHVKVVLAIAVLAPYVVIGVGYMTQPPESPLFYFAGSPYVSHVATSMLANTMPLQDSIDTVKLLTQLNSTMEERSVLLVHESFYGFAAVSIGGHRNIIDYNLGDVMSAVAYAKQLGFAKIYWIWWLPGYGWHGVVNPPPGFNIVSPSGRMAIYVFNE